MVAVAPPPPVRLHLAVGTYEHMVYGLDFSVQADDNGAITGGLEVKKRYAYEPHGAPLTAMGSSGSTLISGSDDELLK